jgi:hypothetical protein
MKTLWDRLSEENQKKLESNGILYPSITKSLISELQNNYTYTDLRFESVIFLVQELTKEDKGWVVLIDDLFNPVLHNEKV